MEQKSAHIADKNRLSKILKICSEADPVMGYHLLITAGTGLFDAPLKRCIELVGLDHQVVPLTPKAIAKAAVALSKGVRPEGRVSEKVIKARLKACLSCPHRAAMPRKGVYKFLRILGEKDICSLCGCVLMWKASLKSERCPGFSSADPNLTRWEEALEY